MDCWSPIVPKATRGEENTTTNTSIISALGLVSTLVRLHYLYVAPLIVLGIPSAALLNGTIPVLSLTVVAGLIGTVLARKRLVLLASTVLLFLLIWGKVALDLSRSSPPDTAVFLVEFGTVLFLMEASLTVVTFNRSLGEIKKDDESSKVSEARLRLWLRHQLSGQSKIAIGSLGLSVVLLPLAGFTSISSTQLPLTGALLLLAIISFLFLVTHRREPEKG